MTFDGWPNEDDMLAELYGGAWADLAGWAERCSEGGCVICQAGHPYGVIGELEHTWITTDRDVALFGYVCVISKVHAVEPYELPRNEQTAFWAECMAVADALAQHLRPLKMNYEIHGNTLPHLHMHVLPRQHDDPFVGRPIDLKEFHHRYSDADLDAMRAVLTTIRSAD